jgi:hypothetical protein
MKRKPSEPGILDAHQPTLVAISKAADKNPACVANTVRNLAKDLGIKIKKRQEKRR